MAGMAEEKKEMENALAKAQDDLEAADMKTCTLCGQKKLVSEMTDAHAWERASTQYRCNECNKLRRRVQRMLARLENADMKQGYQDLNPQERKEFYNKAGDLCGDKLNKELKESIETSSIERSTCRTSQHGNFMIIPEAQDTFKKKHRSNGKTFLPQLREPRANTQRRK